MHLHDRPNRVFFQHFLPGFLGKLLLHQADLCARKCLITCSILVLHLRLVSDLTASETVAITGVNPFFFQG